MLVQLRFRLFKRHYLLLLALVAGVSIITYLFVIKSPNLVESTTTSNIAANSMKWIRNWITKSSQTICSSYTVPDNRSFFEREPIQLNLPRRIPNLSHQDLLHHLRSLRLVVVSCARNVEQYVDKFRTSIEPIVDLFHPSSKILILESDSTDNTLQKLRNWSRPIVYAPGNLINSTSERTVRIAFCRNTLLNQTYKLTPDYILVADFDIFATSISSFLSNFRYNTDDWSVMTPTASNAYYDVWALRTLSDSVLNFDVWHRIAEIQRSGAGYCSQSIIDQIVGNNQKRIPVERGLIEVRSAFGGAGLYKANATNGCKYDGAHITCEHIPFHSCMREKHQARIFINPEFIIG